MDEDLIQSIIILCVLCVLTISGIIILVIAGGELLNASAFLSYYTAAVGLVLYAFIIWDISSG